MQYFERGGWVNIPIMKAAIAKSGRRFASLGELWAPVGDGVTLIQWLGPWMNEGVPIAARSKYRHWVGCRDGFVWDVNLQMWDTRKGWNDWVPTIYPKRATGHKVQTTLLITH